MRWHVACCALTTMTDRMVWTALLGVLAVGSVACDRGDFAAPSTSLMPTVSTSIAGSGDKGALAVLADNPAEAGQADTGQ